MRYTRSRPVPVMYSTAEAVLWMECFKLLVCVLLVIASHECDARKALQVLQLQACQLKIRDFKRVF